MRHVCGAGDYALLSILIALHSILLCTYLPGNPRRRAAMGMTGDDAFARRAAATGAAAAAAAMSGGGGGGGGFGTMGPPGDEGTGGFVLGLGWPWALGCAVWNQLVLAGGWSLPSSRFKGTAKST